MPLTDNLLAVWKLDEASGARADSFGSNNLTDNNTVTQNPGKLGNSAQFTRVNSEWLSIADNADLSGGDRDLTWAAWVYLDSKASDINTIIGKLDFAAGDTREYALKYEGGGSDVFQLNVYKPGIGSAGVAASTFGSPSLSTWYLVIAWHDATANTINICVNDGTVDSVSWSNGMGDSAVECQIGAIADSARYFWDGRIDYVCMWNRVLTSGERTSLYNGGAGNDFLIASTLNWSSIGNNVIHYNSKFQNMQYGAGPAGVLWNTQVASGISFSRVERPILRGAFRGIGSR